MSNNNVVNALVYADTKNHLTATQLGLSNLSSRLDFDDKSSISDQLDEILSNTVIKRACCMNKNKSGITDTSYDVRVRIPIPDSYTFDEHNSNTELWKKFGYIDKTVSVPASMCDAFPHYENDNNKCYDFMALYCNNVKQFYKNSVAKLNSGYNDDEFARYKPECACYGDQPSYISGSIPAHCYAPGCALNESFLDESSREPCSVTICTANFNAADMAVGGDANINSKVTQNCGDQINDAKADAEAAEKARLQQEAADAYAARQAEAAEQARLEQAAIDEQARSDQEIADAQAAAQAAAQAVIDAQENENSYSAEELEELQQNVLDANNYVDELVVESSNQNNEPVANSTTTNTSSTSTPSASTPSTSTPSDSTPVSSTTSTTSTSSSMSQNNIIMSSVSFSCCMIIMIIVFFIIYKMMS
jgi:hypothetical protein